MQNPTMTAIQAAAIGFRMSKSPFLHPDSGGSGLAEAVARGGLVHLDISGALSAMAPEAWTVWGGDRSTRSNDHRCRPVKRLSQLKLKHIVLMF